MKNKLIAALSVVALIFSSATVSAEQWQTFKGDQQRSGTVSLDFPTELSKVWLHRIPTKVTSSPIVVDEQLLIGGLDGVLYAFDLKPRPSTGLWPRREASAQHQPRTKRTATC